MAEILQTRVTYAGGTIVGPAVSTLYFTVTGSDTVDATAARDKLAAFFAACKTNFCQVIYTFGGVCDVIESTTGDLLRSVTVPTVIDAGSASGEALPAANQLNIRTETGFILRNRRLRGHWYMPGFAEVSSNGNPSGSIVANVTAAKVAMLAGSVRPLVWSRPVGPHGATRLGQAVVVSDMNVVLKFAILRSRRD